MRRQVGSDILIALAIFSLCLGVYNATLTPSLSYLSPDGNELATIPYILGLAHSTGYPLYTWLGKLFTFLPIGDIAHRINLMSAILGAAGVALLYIILRLLTSNARQWISRLAAAFAALLFGFSRTFWSQTTIAEVYAPNLFMVTLTVLLLLWWARVEKRDRDSRPTDQTWWRRLLPSWRSALLLFLFGLCFGLSMGTHMSNLGFGPAVALFILLVSAWAALSPISIASAGIGFGIGLLQFLWLPLRADTLLDIPMRANAPTTLKGIYRYTLGAFPEFKFAFPLTALPDRVVVYLYFLIQQFGFIGVALGLLGMWALLFRRPRRFFLFMGMYLVHVWFFIQYRAFDLEVFFILAHLIYAVFIGYGIWWLLHQLANLRWRGVQWLLVGSVTLLLTLGLLREVRANWEINDHSNDTAINDFYENVFDLLPEGAVILSRGGVFGYDLFYYPLVYNVRPDLLIPAMEPDTLPQNMGEQAVYSTIPLDQLQGGRNPWAPPGGWVDRESWSVPVLLGATAEGRRGQGLALYRITDEPPELVVMDAQPQYIVEEALNGLELVGYDLAEDTVQAGGTIQLTLYWRATERPQRILVGTVLGETVLEVHEPGFGNLQRYVKTIKPTQDGLFVEEYQIVIPQQTKAGVQSLEVIAVAPFNQPGQRVTERIVLQALAIVPASD